MPGAGRSEISLRENVHIIQGIRAVVDFGREAKKATIRTIERAGEVKDNIKEGLRTAVENSTQTLEDLNGER